MSASFPSSVRTFATILDIADSVLAAHQNERGDEITAIETELGVSPSGSENSVVLRLDRMELLERYVITPSVATNNLTLAIKDINGNDPSATNPIKFRVGNTLFSLEAATSIVKNAGTNYGGRGASETAAKNVDWFVYAIAETGASAGLKFGISPVPYATTMSDLSATATAQNAIIGNYTNRNTTDAVQVIGRFRAQLSASASYNWSIPNANVINYPIFETDWLTWLPTITGYSALPTNVVYRYMLRGSDLLYEIVEITGGTSNLATKTYTAPFTAKTLTNMVWAGLIPITFDNGSYGACGFTQVLSASNVINMYRSGIQGWTATGSSSVPLVNGRFSVG
jgi:hypothetical protein